MTPIDRDSMASTVSELWKAIDNSQKNSHMAEAKITLLAASKEQSPERIEAAIAAGITDFGENRVQEAQAKWPALKAKHSHLRLHLIGPLQTNKVEEALALFDVIQTVDRPKLAEAIARFQGPGIRCQKLFIQINTGEEPQKAGVRPQEADALIEYCKELRLPVVGLMCIPPADHPPAPHFALLREIARRHGLKELSMGMSEDFETAVRMGATCVRVGRALFGHESRAMSHGKIGPNP